MDWRELVGDRASLFTQDQQRLLDEVQAHSPPSDGSRPYFWLDFVFWLADHLPDQTANELLEVLLTHGQDQKAQSQHAPAAGPE